MRKAFAKIHLWFSIPFGIIISVICLSGAALVFEQDITRALNPGFYRVEVEDGAKPLTPSELVMKLRTQLPDALQISGLQMSGDPEEAWMVSFEHLNRKTLSVNPYTGEINGWNKSYPFFQTMRKLHRWLMDVPPQKGDKTVGKTIVGVTTLVFVAILISGVVIWIPQTKKALKNRLQVSCNKGWRRFWYDSHVSLGFYTTLFLLVMALTGLTWSFTWYRTAVYSLFGGTAPKVKNTPRPEYRTERCRKTVPSGQTAAYRQRKRPERNHFQLCRMGQSRRRCPSALSDLQVGQTGYGRYRNSPQPEYRPPSNG